QAFRNNRHWELKFGSSGKVGRAAKPVTSAIAGILTRSDTIELEAADHLAVILEQVEYANTIAVKFMNITGTNAQHTNNIGFLHQRLIIVTLEGSLHELGITTKPCKLLCEAAKQTVTRVLHVVNRIIGQRIADRRPQPRTKFASLNQCWGIIFSVRLSIGSTVRQVIFFLHKSIGKTHREIISNRQAKADRTPCLLDIIATARIDPVRATEDVKTCRYTIAEEIRLSKRQAVITHIIFTSTRADTNILTTTKEVTLGNCCLY